MPRIPPPADDEWDNRLRAILGRRSPGLAGRLDVLTLAEQGAFSTGTRIMAVITGPATP